ncbi:MAG: hypothetical protein AABX30_00655 [Nanoarchaeota archaeon]
MIQGNYDRIVKKIASASGLGIDEIERRIEAKKAKLSGLISKEGASQIIAAELGISFDNEKLKIEELIPGMKKVNVIGKVINLSPVRSFSKNGREGKVANFVIADETSNIKVVLWDVNHISLIEENKIIEDSVVEILNGSMRDNEIHLGSFSELKISNENLKEVNKEKIVKEKEISDFKIAENLKTRAFVVQIFDLKFFDVCPECKKKLAYSESGELSCLEHGNVAPEKRALVNLVLDDGTATIRAVFFHDLLGKISFDNFEDVQALSEKKKVLLGKEMFFSGTARQNKFFNNLEFIIDNVEEVNLQELIKKLEEKIM